MSRATGRQIFGDDVHHAARRTVTVAGSSRATDHFDALDHLRRDPAGIAAGITLAAPAQTDGVAAGDRLAVDQIRVFSGPMPRMSI